MGAIRTHIEFVRSDEPLARYLLESNRFRKPNQARPDGEVTERAFLPPPDLKTSVFRIDGLALTDVKTLGVSVAAESGKPCHGHAQIQPAQVSMHGLAVEPDDDPPRHANIVGWSEDKDKRKIVAQLLAAAALLYLYQ